MILYTDFAALISSADKYNSLDEYMTEAEQSASSDYPPQVYTMAYYAAKKDIKSICTCAGKYMRDISTDYDIPYRTVQNWAATSKSKRDTPKYIMRLIAYAEVNNLM